MSSNFNNSRGNAALTGNTSGMGEWTLSILGIVAVYLVFMFIEVIYAYIQRLQADRTELIPKTCNMESRSKVIPQNPTLSNAKPIMLSRNERSGIEFTYSFYIRVDPSSFRQEEGLLHVFHKGYSSEFPLLAPGVFMKSNTNTMRVYMNTYKTWNNYIDIDNFPVDKWVHVAVACKEKALEIYINGNLSKKMSFEGHVPYQNYQDIVCFSQRRVSILKSRVPSLKEDLNIFGSAKGQLSRLYYFSYALCYAEIQKLLNEGPSTEMDEESMTDRPPYLADRWWAENAA